MIAAVSEWVVAAPLGVIVGLLLGFWVGGRYEIRKHKDANGS